MKPLELSSITEVWRSALAILADSLHPVGHELQVWFPWGKTWRGHDRQGILPPTDLPTDLIRPAGAHFAGRFWKAFPVNGITWLVSFKSDQKSSPLPPDWFPPEKTQNALSLLAETVRMECLLGLAMKILENRAAEEAGHWDRVRNLGLAVGRHLGLAARELIDLELAAMLHDIGKVALPQGILEDARPLTPAERKQMETHSLIGATMIREIPGLERVADYVLCHHEAPDGTGYPKGLRDPDIPLSALIIGAVDSFDAMTHFRPYASQRTYRESIGEMTRQNGKHDPRVLWALQDVLKRLGILETRPMVSAPEL